MQAIQRIVQLSLILVISLTQMGFRVNLEDCPGHEEKQISFFGAPDCCCDKSKGGKESKKHQAPCQDVTCVVQSNIQSQHFYSAASQQLAKIIKANPVSRVYTHLIWPALQEQIPHFYLPPPSYSGRFIGILHQVFII